MNRFFDIHNDGVLIALLQNSAVLTDSEVEQMIQELQICVAKLSTRAPVDKKDFTDIPHVVLTNYTYCAESDKHMVTFLSESDKAHPLTNILPTLMTISNE